jgi:hypothetical protein
MISNHLLSTGNNNLRVESGYFSSAEKTIKNISRKSERGKTYSS